MEKQLRDGASRIAAMQCRWLLLLAEFVVRGRWADGGGARTPGRWLSWAVGEAAPTAREHVRVALALRHLPLIRGRFAAETLSYSKVRALTRVAVPEIEQRLLDLADSAPASVLSRILAKSRWSAKQRQRWADDTPHDQARQLAVDEAAADGQGGSRPLPRGARKAIAIRDALTTAVAASPPDRSGLDSHLVVLHVQAADLADAVIAGDAAETAAAPTRDAAEAADAGATAPAHHPGAAVGAGAAPCHHESGPIDDAATVGAGLVDLRRGPAAGRHRPGPPSSRHRPPIPHHPRRPAPCRAAARPALPLPRHGRPTAVRTPTTTDRPATTLWDGAGYDLNETMAIVGDMLLDVAA